VAVVPSGLSLPTPRNKIDAHTCMPRVRLESTTPVFERAKTVHALYRRSRINLSKYTLLRVLRQE
jgi:hypothetical protein